MLRSAIGVFGFVVIQTTTLSAQGVTDSSVLRIDSLLVSTSRATGAASSSIIQALDIQLRPRASSQELLRLAPGLVIAQHAGGGKAEQIFLRGFDADHGTDVAISVDGLPVNMVSHAHGQGYADLHFVIPELVERIDVRKGPFDVRDGDFATAGAIAFTTRDRIAAPFTSFRYGSFRSAHALAMIPLGRRDGGGGYIAAAGTRSDGPFEAPQDHRRLNLAAKWTSDDARGSQLFVQTSLFGAEWDASGQVPDRAVRAGLIGRFGALDRSEGGRTARADASAGIRSLAGGTSQWKAQVFATRYYFNLFSNFTFFLNDSIRGDGIEQLDDRIVYGAHAEYGSLNTIANLAGRWTAGTGIRRDRADVGLYRQQERTRLGPQTEEHVDQDAVFAYARQDVQLGRLQLNAGLRADAIRFDVASHTAWNGIVNFRANAAFDAGAGVVAFLNAGTGFHSNDARQIIPRGDSGSFMPQARSIEAGASRIFRRGAFTMSAWLLDLESELVYVGDEGITEPSGATRRVGVDAAGRTRLTSWLWWDADLNVASGRFVDAPKDESNIPLAPRVTATAGLTVRDAGPVQAGVRLRHIGTRPADETDTIRALGYTVWEAFAKYEYRGVELTASIDNLLNRSWNEAQFATTSRLHHEPSPVTELHYTPGAPRSLQIGIARRF